MPSLYATAPSTHTHKNCYKHLKYTVLTSAAHKLKLEQYREDSHGSYTRMTCKKLSSLGMMISPWKCQFLPPIQRADLHVPWYSLGSSGFPYGSSFFHIFICLLVPRHLHQSRDTARLVVCTYILLYLPPRPPAISASHQDSKGMCSFCQQVSDTFTSAKGLTYFIPWWERKHDIFLIIKAPLFLATKGKFNILQAPNATFN